MTTSYLSFSNKQCRLDVVENVSFLYKINLINVMVSLKQISVLFRADDTNLYQGVKFLYFPKNKRTHDIVANFPILSQNKKLLGCSKLWGLLDLEDLSSIHFPIFNLRAFSLFISMLNFVYF